MKLKKQKKYGSMAVVMFCFGCLRCVSNSSEYVLLNFDSPFQKSLLQVAFDTSMQICGNFETIKQECPGAPYCELMADAVVGRLVQLHSTVNKLCDGQEDLRLCDEDCLYLLSIVDYMQQQHSQVRINAQAGYFTKALVDRIKQRLESRAGE